MSQITIERDGIDISVTSKGCTVTPDTEPAVVVTWEQVNDVEYLSTAFGEYRVSMFKTIVEMLGKIHANKAAYKGML